MADSPSPARAGQCDRENRDDGGRFAPGHVLSTGNRGNRKPRPLLRRISANRAAVARAFNSRDAVEVLRQLKLAGMGGAIASVTVTTDESGQETRVETYHPPDVAAAKVFLEQVIGRLKPINLSDDDGVDGKEQPIGPSAFVFIVPQNQIPTGAKIVGQVGHDPNGQKANDEITATRVARALSKSPFANGEDQLRKPGQAQGPAPSSE